MAKKNKVKKNPQPPQQEQKVEKQEQPTTLLSSAILIMITFLSGGLVMVIELTSSRLLAPYYGNTIYCWTGVIGIILFAMSLGYLVGGIAADKYPKKEKLLMTLLACSAFSVAIIPLLAGFFFASFLESLSAISGPILGTLIIFAVPGFFLSMMPPLCVKIVASNFRLVGLASGVISSVSAMGSIIGTFATGFILIPSFRLATIYYMAALLLLTLFIVVFFLRNKIAKLENLVFVVLLAIVLGIFWEEYYKKEQIFPHTQEVYSELTPYHLIRVYDGGDHYLLKLDSTNEGAVYKDSSRLKFEYTRYWELIKCFLPEEKASAACFVGGGAFGMPMMYHKNFPDVTVDAVEIDPALKDVAKKFFHLDKQGKNFQVQIEDGRRWFRDKKDSYGFIFLDAFHGERNIPFHLVTSEYFGKLSDALHQDGVLALNMISARSGNKTQLYRSLTKTLLQHFGRIFIFSPHDVTGKISSNLILFCVKDGVAIDKEKLEQRARREGILELYQKLVKVLSKEDLKEYQDVEIFTDQYAPVEYMIAGGF